MKQHSRQGSEVPVTHRLTALETKMFHALQMYTREVSMEVIIQRIDNIAVERKKQREKEQVQKP